MKLLHKTSSFSFNLIHTGFLTFKNRIREVLCAKSGLNLEDYVDDETLCTYYRNGESEEFVAATIMGTDFDFDDELVTTF